jgi:NADH:ubiquinone oxidoreductase subunit C
LSINYKLFLKCLFSGINYSFISHKLHEKKNSNVFISSSKFYFLALHIRFSSIFYGSQLIDIFSYEVPQLSSRLDKVNSSIFVYNFHSIRNQDRILVFTHSGDSCLYSISELFSAGNWLEREAHEMHGGAFIGKKDIRNLMLQYGDSSAPLQKSFPSIGLREMFYDPIKDVVVQNPVSVQI